MRLLAVILLASCKFTPPGATDASGGDDAKPIDAPGIDGELDAQIIPPGSTCVGTLVKVCVTTVPGDRNITSSNFDTDDDNNCDQILHGPSGPAVCVLQGHNLTLTGSLDAFGKRPLVLVAFDNLTISNNVALSVSSSAIARGAGASDACVLTATDGGDSAVVGGGGGAGGTHRGAGGNGGDSTGMSGAPGPLVAAWPFVRGGCPGGKGGASGLSPGGSGGAGGGAILLIAKNMISVHNNAGISASGAGGQGGVAGGGGGGGGGSGGFIGFDGGTVAIDVTARVAANGGGGASGGAITGGSPGDNGKDSASVARGGPANGGDGSAGANLTGVPGGGAGIGVGAGGGGGGAGAIISVGADDPSTGTFSPSPVLLP